MKMVSFRIRRRYFDKIVSGEKKEELRSFTPFWIKRLANADVAVFVCGKDVHRRWIKKVWGGFPEEVLGRPLSEQGQKDIKTETCLVVELGEIYDSKSLSRTENDKVTE